MKQLTDKQKLALNRGQFIRFIRGIKSTSGALYLFREEKNLSLEERMLIQQIYLTACKIDENAIEEGVKLGLKRKVLNNIEII